MVILDASISTIPFELHGNELLLKGLISRYPKAFKRIACNFEAGFTEERLVLIPDRKGKVRFFKSGDAIGVAYVRPTNGCAKTFPAVLGQMIKDATEDRQKWDAKHDGLVQRGMHPALVAQLKALINEDF